MDQDYKNRLAQAWLTMQENWWAYESLIQLIENEPNDAWETIIFMIGKTDNDMLIENIGAGPLEEFIDHHKTAYISIIENRAATDEKFKKALSHVWITNNEDPICKKLLALGCVYRPAK